MLPAVLENVFHSAPFTMFVLGLMLLAHVTHELACILPCLSSSSFADRGPLCICHLPLCLCCVLCSATPIVCRCW